MKAKTSQDKPLTHKPPSSLGDAEKHQAFLMFLSGFPPVEIARRTGLSHDVVKQWATRGKWNEQKRELENYHSEKNPPMAQPIMKAVANSRKGELRKKFLENTGEMAAEDAEHWKNLDPQERLVVAPAIGALNNVHRKNLGLEDEDDDREKGHISLTFLSQSSQPGFVKLIEPEKVKEIEQEADPMDDPAFR